jgi:hypothetical protein
MEAIFYPKMYILFFFSNYSVTTQMTILFILTAMRASNPTNSNSDSNLVQSNFWYYFLQTRFNGYTDRNITRNSVAKETGIKIGEAKEVT